MNTIWAMIIAIAIETGIPPYFALAIALEENNALNPLAVNCNPNGTYDRGVMQLNSGWFTGDWQDPATNIRAGCELIKALMTMPGVNTFWAIAVCYNAGYGRLNNPPASTIDYAERVILRWKEMDRRGFRILTGGR